MSKNIKSVAVQLARNGYLAYSISLNGKGIGQDAYKFMKELPIGSLVLEVTAGMFGILREDREDIIINALGHLEEIAMEPIEYDGWDEKADGPIPQEKVYYIRTLDDRRFRWVNASFIRLIDSAQDMRDANA